MTTVPQLSSSQLAIDGGTPVRQQPFQGWPIWDEREEQALLRALHSGQWGIGGEETEAFEREYRAGDRGALRALGHKRHGGVGGGAACGRGGLWR